MSKGHLLLVTIGPIQEFIAQARRTRDLWFGSHALSELSRAAARTLAKNDATLIFPALDKGDPELEPCDPPLRPGPEPRRPPLSIVNKILAELPAGYDPADHAATARGAVMARWRQIAERVWNEDGLARLLTEHIEEVWCEQTDEAIEFYAAWQPLTNGYKKRVRLSSGRSPAVRICGIFRFGSRIGRARRNRALTACESQC